MWGSPVDVSPFDRTQPSLFDDFESVGVVFTWAVALKTLG